MMDIGRLQDLGKIVAQGKLLLTGPLLCTATRRVDQNKLKEMMVTFERT